MKITIKNEEIELKYSNRMFLIYEQNTGESLDFSSKKSFTTMINALYASILSSIHINKLDITFSFDELLEILDSDEGYDIVSEYTGWLLEHMSQPLKSTETSKKK